MKKLYIGIIFGVFALASFMALNLYTSTSFPGYGNNEACNNCHNQPALVKDVQASFSLNNFTQANQVFNKYGQWATDEVPTIPTNNRSDANLAFIRMSFIKNSTDVMVMAQVNDPTPTTKGTSAATSDKFGIIFNVDVVNFTVGQFLTSYNSTATNLNNVLSGQMAFSTGGHADLWYVDVGTIGTNTTGYAVDKSISTGITTDPSSEQNVQVGIYFGGFDHGSGYQYFFVRPISPVNSNTDQVNFAKNGQSIHYAIAWWNNEQAEYHHSSFDQMVIVGNQFNVIQTSTQLQTTTVTTTTTASSSKTSGTTSSFTVVFVLAALVISIPIVSHYRRRRE